ncbi:phosphatase PAP2 family protein [Terrabacter terrigena]|uniref:Phosphatase PAP2 family protein n=1 Tax=Terrabacter terrigena TaxID=574718 RepID=A0ABW3MUX6_9MICO
MPHRDRLGWALLALASAGGLVVTALVVGRTGVGVTADEAVRNWLLNTLPGPLRLGLDRIARPLVIVALAPTVCVLALLALVRRSWRRAVAGLAVPAAATLTTLELRGRDAFGIGGDAFPSNHAAAGLGLLVGLAVVWPRPVTRRGLVALVVGALVVGLGNVTWYAHQPRDVLASALVVVGVAAASFAALGGDSPNLARASGEPTRTGPAQVRSS